MKSSKKNMKKKIKNNRTKKMSGGSRRARLATPPPNNFPIYEEPVPLYETPVPVNLSNKNKNTIYNIVRPLARLSGKSIPLMPQERPPSRPNLSKVPKIKNNWNPFSANSMSAYKK